MLRLNFPLISQNRKVTDLLFFLPNQTVSNFIMKKPTQKTLTEKETDKVNETTRLLSHSVQIARETDSLSNITLEEMTKQGKQLEQTQKQLQGTEGIALNTNTAVKKLQQRIYERKVYLWATIIGLFLIILLLLFRMVTNHGKLFA